MERKRKILLIDDEEEYSFIVKGRLEKEGFDVCTAANGEDGLRVFTDFRPDLVLLDIVMPGMDGMQVLRKLRRDFADLGNLPIIMLTAKRDTVSLFDSQRYRVTDYIMKPFEYAELIALINKYIRLYNNKD